MNQINQSYEELDRLITNQENLSDFFLRKHDYKAICIKAMDNHSIQLQDRAIINALNEHLPLEAWFDKDTMFKAFIDTYQEQVHTAVKYRWCMELPKVRQCFTPEEKGKFVRLGMALEDHQMAYHGTLDHDWDGKITMTTLIVELRKINRTSIRVFDGEHLQKNYLEWISEEILPKTSNSEQYFFILGTFDVAVNHLRQISEMKNLVEIEFNLNKKVSFTQIAKVEQDLKDCIKHIKNQLYFDVWPDNFKDYFIKFSTDEPVSISSNNFLDRDKIDQLQEFGKDLIPIIEYAKLNAELSNSNTVEAKKLKL
jgi:hypothetical protein